MNDTELVLACQTGDQHAFNWLIKRHQSTVFGLLYKLGPDLNDHADLGQEAFIRLWRNIRRLRDPRAFRSWLKRIVTNLFYDQLRHRSKNLVVSIDETTDLSDPDEFVFRQIADPKARPDELLERRQLAETIHGAVADLCSQSRRMIELRDIQGLSYSEIAVLMKCRIGTVKSRISRARSKLQVVLLPYFKASA
jgi:RNA polymerase sigma-70 factor (ECF subfamily)